MSYYDPHRVGLRNQNYKYSKRGQIIQKKLSDSPPDLMHVRDIDKETWYAYLKTINYNGLGSYEPLTALLPVQLRGFNSGETLDDYIADLGQTYSFIQIYCSPFSSFRQIFSADSDDRFPCDLQASTECCVVFYSLDDIVYFQVVTPDREGIVVGFLDDISSVSSIGDSYSEMSSVFKNYIASNAISFVGYANSLYEF